MKKIVFILAILIPVIFSGCQTDDLFNDNSGKQGNLNGFSLSYHVSDAVSALTKTNIAAEEGEEQINSLYILFFENTTGGTGQFIETIDAMNGKTMLTSAGTVDVIFPENSKLNKNEEYKMLLCANIKDYLSTTSTFSNVDELNGLCDGKTENEVSNMLLQISGVEPSAADEETDNSNLMPMNNLPMTAKLTKEINKTTYSAELTRAVSRFDVVCDAEGFTLVSASIWNGYTMATAWETGFTNFSQARTERYYGVGVNENNEIIGSLYALENYVPLANVQQNDKVSTCLIVGLLRKGRTQVEYFRINANVGSRGQELKRNNVYRMTIMNVNSKGDDTEREAYENPKRLTDYLILTPETHRKFSAGGGATELITVFASGPWKAEVTKETNTEAYFSEADDESNDEDEDDGDENETVEKDPPLIKKWDSLKDKDSFYLSLSSVKDLNKEGAGEITFTLTGETPIKQIVKLEQDKLQPTDLLVQVRRRVRAGSLFELTRAATHSYVYDLAMNMRNPYLFGPLGTVSMETGYVFMYNGSASTKVKEEAKIYQVTGKPASAVFNKLRTNMSAGKLKMIILCNHDAYASDALERYKTAFKSVNSNVSEYSATTSNVSGSAALNRLFKQNPDLDDKLIAYLLDGPFGKVDPEKISLKSRSGTDKALTKWPNTFVPLIMAAGNPNYCVFGIDPTNRMVWMSDPGIFGSKPTSNYQNKSNFPDNSDNEKFMNNFIAWLTYAVAEDSFLEKFQYNR